MSIKGYIISEKHLKSIITRYFRSFFHGLQQFSSRNVFGFTHQDVERVFQEKNRVYLARILVNMVDKGILCKIARDTLICNFSSLNILDY